MSLVIGRTPQRKPNPRSQVWIGDDICISVLQYHGGVRLLIDAPKALRILRGEVKAGLEQEEPRNEQ